MGILDFFGKKKDAPAPAGATETSAASPEALKAEIARHGLDASKVEIAVDGSKVTLSGSAATTADAEKLALAVGNTQGVAQVVNNIDVQQAHAEFSLLHREVRRHPVGDRGTFLRPRAGSEVSADLRGQSSAADRSQPHLSGSGAADSRPCARERRRRTDGFGGLETAAGSRLRQQGWKEGGGRGRLEIADDLKSLVDHDISRGVNAARN